MDSPAAPLNKKREFAVERRNFVYFLLTIEPQLLPGQRNSVGVASTNVIITIVCT